MSKDKKKYGVEGTPTELISKIYKGVEKSNTR